MSSESVSTPTVRITSLGGTFTSAVPFTVIEREAVDCAAAGTAIRTVTSAAAGATDRIMTFSFRRGCRVGRCTCSDAGRAEGGRWAVSDGRDAEVAVELPGEMALIGKPRGCGDAGQRFVGAADARSGPLQTKTTDARCGRLAKRAFELADDVRGVDAGNGGKLLELWRSPELGTDVIRDS